MFIRASHGPSPALSAGLPIPLLALAWFATGCSGGELPGDYFKVTLTGADNLCTGGGADYSQNYEYRLEIEGNDVLVAIGEDIWATGRLDGCNLTYTSLAWSSYREDLEIQWLIQGSARINAGGGGGCVEGLDWEGTETFVITESAHPDVSAGCTYILDAVGKYEQTIGDSDGPTPPGPTK